MGASVTSGTASTTTDVNGIFRLHHIQLSERFGYVKVVKAGYFTGSRTIFTNANATNFVRIDLLPKTSIGDFAAASGGEIKLPSGPSAAFETNSIVMAAGNTPYNGNVHVYATYLDPTAENIGTIMPGDLRGVTAGGKETGLQSFGMMAVELEGDGGEKLQIAAGKKATLKMPIPASLQAAAPATIPLWHFNDTTGKWIEEGSATRDGNSYVGQVSHFSYWNWDYPCGIVFFQVNIKDQHGNPFAYGNLDFRSDAYGTQGGQTDSAGHTQGWLIKGGTYTMRVKDECGNILYTQKVGPALNDQNLGTVTVSDTRTSLILTGKVVDCSQNLVAHGYVNAFVDGLNYRAEVLNGNFTLSLNRCSSLTTDVKLAATDNATLLQGPMSTVSAASGTVDAGTLTACGAKFEQYIHFTLNGQSYSIESPRDTIQMMKLSSSSNYISYVGGSDSGRPAALMAMNPVSGTGTLPLKWLILDDGHAGYYSTSSNPAHITISSYGELFGFVEGTFTASVFVPGDSVATYGQASGNFKIKRTL